MNNPTIPAPRRHTPLAALTPRDTARATARIPVPGPRRPITFDSAL